jgi:hypothetical protein
LRFTIDLLALVAMPVAVLLCGRAHAGKSTAAACLMAAVPGFTELSFAGPLKAICLDACRLLLPRAAVEAVTAEWFHDPVLKATPLQFLETPLTPRVIMQTLGTDVLRAHLGPDVFVHGLLARAAEAAAAGKHIVVSDVRFPNEAAVAAPLQAMGYRVIRLRIVREAGFGTAATTAAAHISETGAEDLPVDAVITNNGSVADLSTALLAVCF